LLSYRGESERQVSAMRSMKSGKSGKVDEEVIPTSRETSPHLLEEADQ